MIPVASRVGPIILAHRGGDEKATENTLEAFSYAYSLGIRHIETDVHLTADGLVVVSHDPTLDRCFGVHARISDMTYREISHLRDAQGHRMPLLAEALTAFPTMYFNIDAKAKGVEGPLLEVLSENRALDRVLVTSFDESRVRRMREATRARVATSLGMSAVVRLVGAAKTASHPARWRVPGAHLGVVAAQVPQSFGRITVVDRRFVAAAHSLGLAVHVWTVDEPEEIMSLIGLGVDGIVTNRPRFVRDFLSERGLWARPAPPSAPKGQGARD